MTGRRIVQPRTLGKTNLARITGFRALDTEGRHVDAALVRRMRATGAPPEFPVAYGTSVSPPCMSTFTQKSCV